jgi:hypothetical protein
VVQREQSILEEGRSPTLRDRRSTGKTTWHPDASAEWMVHFTVGRNPTDRGFYERESSIPLPSDGELTDCADEFEVLAAQVRLGGLLPGFPDAIGRRYSPRSYVVAQSTSCINFARRDSVCGVVFLETEFIDAGASQSVLPGRPDLYFDGLLGWATEGRSAEFISYHAGHGNFDKLLGLPVWDHQSLFSTVGVMVDNRSQATAIQEALVVTA